MSLAPFVVWAPLPATVDLMIKPVGDAVARKVAMKKDDDGWWRPVEPLPDVRVGEFDYGFRLNGAEAVLPDPRSRRQPNGVHGWSRTHDADRFGWTDHAWTGRQLAGAVIYDCLLYTSPSPRD